MRARPTRSSQPAPTSPTHGAPPLVAARASSRLPALDVARGLAMVLVCLSHFVWSATQTVGDTRTFDLLTKLSMIATPTFLLVSGITLGYLHGLRGDGYRRLATKLPERGLLLLSVVHLLMLPALHCIVQPSEHESRGAIAYLRDKATTEIIE